MYWLPIASWSSRSRCSLDRERTWLPWEESFYLCWTNLKLESWRRLWIFFLFLHYGDPIFYMLGELSRDKNSIYPKSWQKSTPFLRNVILTIIRRSFDHPHIEKSVNGTLNVHLYGTSFEQEVLELSHIIQVEPSIKHFLKVSLAKLIWRFPHKVLFKFKDSRNTTRVKSSKRSTENVYLVRNKSRRRKRTFKMAVFLYFWLTTTRNHERFSWMSK